MLTEILGLRKPVQTKREADILSLRLALIILAGIFFVIPHVQAQIEWWQDGSDWVSSEFAVHARNGRVFVDYAASAKKENRSFFIIQTRTSKNATKCTYKSPNRWPYTKGAGAKRVWEWAAWAETSHSGACPPPDVGDYVCLRYEGATLRGKPFDTPYNCQQVRKSDG